jgi:hypothetical protein
MFDTKTPSLCLDRLGTNIGHGPKKKAACSYSDAGHRGVLLFDIHLTREGRFLYTKVGSPERWHHGVKGHGKKTVFCVSTLDVQIIGSSFYQHWLGTKYEQREGSSVPLKTASNAGMDEDGNEFELKRFHHEPGTSSLSFEQHSEPRGVHPKRVWSCTLAGNGTGEGTQFHAKSHRFTKTGSGQT